MVRVTLDKMTKFDLSIDIEDGPDSAAEVWTKGSVMGQPVKFLFDTGCAQTSFPFNALTSTLPVSRSRESSGAISRTRYDIVQVDHLQIGPIEKNGVEISRAQERQLDRYLLGMDLLKEFCLHVKFSDSRVEVLQTNEIPHRQFPLTIDKGSIPYVDFTLNGVSAQGVWDTGAGMTIINKAFLENNSSMFQEIGENERH